MSSHRKRPTRRRRSGRTRALLSLASVGMLATGLSAQGTFAFFSDTATVTTGQFTSGTLDITVDNLLAGPGTLNNPGSINRNALALPTMAPGESVAYSFPVRNNGTLPLLYTITGTGAGPLATTNGMQYAVTVGNATTAAHTNPVGANGLREGRCGGATFTDANTTLLQGSAVTFGPANRSLPVGVTDHVCIVARFSSQAPNGLQGNAGTSNATTAAFVFSATQLGATP